MFHCWCVCVDSGGNGDHVVSCGFSWDPLWMASRGLAGGSCLHGEELVQSERFILFAFWSMKGMECWSARYTRVYLTSLVEIFVSIYRWYKLFNAKILPSIPGLSSFMIISLLKDLYFVLRWCSWVLWYLGSSVAMLPTNMDAGRSDDISFNP